MEMEEMYMTTTKPSKNYCYFVTRLAKLALLLMPFSYTAKRREGVNVLQPNSVSQKIIYSIVKPCTDSNTISNDNGYD